MTTATPTDLHAGWHPADTPVLGDLLRLGMALSLFAGLAVAISTFAPEQPQSGGPMTDWYGNVEVTVPVR